MKRNSIDIITLGCSKNLVDSERLIRQLELNGYTVRHDPEEVKAYLRMHGFEYSEEQRQMRPAGYNG